MNLGDEAAREKMMKELLNDALLGPSTRISKQLNPSKLSQRELPPGNWGQLFLVYQAYCLASNLECASRATFYNCTKSWRAALRFRPLSKHSLCHTCDLIKSKMRHAGDFMSHASATDELLAHLRKTWMCRQSYWHSRELSRSHQDVLCVIFDGFDKSKPVVPRWAHGQQPKHPVFERINRTHIAVSAILAHGYGCFIYLSEEANTAGGTFSWECLMHCIQVCRDEDQRCGRPSPRTLWCQHDNTVKELKNQLSGVVMAAMVQDGLYDECGAHMLPVGHTHEDIGFLALDKSWTGISLLDQVRFGWVGLFALVCLFVCL